MKGGFAFDFLFCPLYCSDNTTIGGYHEPDQRDREEAEGDLAGNGSYAFNAEGKGKRTIFESATQGQEAAGSSGAILRFFAPPERQGDQKLPADLAGRG